MNLNQLRIGTRLGFAFALTLSFTLGLAAVGIARLDDAARATEAMESAMRAARLGEQWQAANQVNNALNLARLRAAGPTDDAALAPRQTRVSASISRIEQALEPMMRSDEGRRLMATIGERRQAYRTARQELFARRDAGRGDAGADETRMDAALQTYGAALTELTRSAEAAARAAQAGQADAIASGVRIMVLCGAAAVTAGVLCAWLLGRSITLPLGQAVQVAHTVAGGDLSVAIAPAAADETGQLLASLKTMTAKLGAIVARVRNAAETMASSTAQIAAGHRDLAGRTETQAATLEEIASSVSRLAASAADNARATMDGKLLADATSRQAADGNAAVAQVVSTMAEIDAASGQIADITAAIESIAFQTGLLALNAAVEAARAGEHGRGFAVVAGEVRMLAQRASNAAQGIKSLAQASTARVRAGTGLARRAGAAMTGVEHDVRRLNRIMDQVAAASQEQSAGIDQVNEALAQIDAVTQQNAALVEEASAATASMHAQAAALERLVGQFRLTPAAAAPRVPANGMRALVPGWTGAPAGALEN